MPEFNQKIIDRIDNDPKLTPEQKYELKVRWGWTRPEGSISAIKPKSWLEDPVGKIGQMIEDKVGQSGPITGFMKAYGNPFDLGNIDPVSKAGVFFPKGSTVYHGTRRIFDYFDPIKHGAHLEQPGAALIHAGFSPQTAEQVAMESRSVGNVARNGYDTTGLNIKPIKISPNQEFLNETALSLEDLQRIYDALVPRVKAGERLLKSKIVPKRPAQVTSNEIAQNKYLLDKLEPYIKGAVNIGDETAMTLFSQMSPRVLDRAGYAGILYDDVAGPAIAMSQRTKHVTPWGVPHTKGKSTLERAVLGENVKPMPAIKDTVELKKTFTPNYEPPKDIDYGYGMGVYDISPQVAEGDATKALLEAVANYGKDPFVSKPTFGTKVADYLEATGGVGFPQEISDNFINELLNKSDYQQVAALIFKYANQYGGKNKTGIINELLDGAMAVDKFK